MFDAIARVLSGIYALPVVGGSYGLSIVLLTLLVMVVLMPLTLRATRSQIKMMQVQPELKRIQKEFKGDREEMNREMMALYQREGINPVGGCIPMLAQLPVFLVLFNVLRGLTRRREDLSYFEVASLVGDVDPAAGRIFEPRYLEPDSAMYQSLSQRDEMPFGPIDLAVQAWDVLQSDFVRALPYLALIALVVFTSYYQQRQIQARRKSDEPMSDVMRQQQAILKFLPLMTGVWSFAFPAGLVVYWFTSNLFRIGQQAYITRQIYNKADLPDAGGNGPDKDDLPKVGRGKDADGGTDTERGATKTKAKNKNSDDTSASAKAEDTKRKASDDDGSSSRSQRWADQKKRAEAKRRQNTPKPSSGRTTPKGTQARPSNKKKRKR